MTTPFATKLRDEIEATQKRRHDFILKKFTFGGTLLGLGSLSVPVSLGKSITLAPLLYIVPLLAIAYDIYIVAEDYGIKRAGAFLRLQDVPTENSERMWERFVSRYDRSLAPFGFFIATMTFLLAASLLIIQTAYQLPILLSWIAAIILIDGALLYWSLSLRRRMRTASLPEDDASKKPNSESWVTRSGHTTPVEQARK